MKQQQARPFMLRKEVRPERKQLFVAVGIDDPGFRICEYNTASGAHIETLVYTAEQLDRCFAREGF